MEHVIGNNVYCTAEEKLSPSFFLFLFYIAVWWLQLGERFGQRFGTEIRLEAIVAGILLLVTCFDSFRRKPEEKCGLASNVLWFLAVLLLQVLVAWDVERAWYVYVQNVLKYSAMGLLISRFVRTPQQLGWFIFVWLLACWKGTLEGVIGGITGSLVWENQGIMRLNGNGLWAHPNSFSQFALGTIPFCYFLFPLTKRYWLKAGILSLFGFATYVVIFTGSRTGYLGFLSLMLLFYIQSTARTRKRLVIGILLMLPVTCAALPQSYQERFLSSFTGQEKEGNSKGARLNLYKQGIEVFLKHPLGIGVGNYRKVNELYYGRAMDQHCLITESLTEIGIHGTIIFVVLLCRVRTVLKNLIMRMEPLQEVIEESRLVLAVAKSIYLYFLLRLFMDLFGMDLYGIAWWFIIGTASSLHYISHHVVLAKTARESTAKDAGAFVTEAACISSAPVGPEANLTWK